MVKHQTSITIDEDVILAVKAKLRDGTFRNQSHLFEFAVRKLLDVNRFDVCTCDREINNSKKVLEEK